MWNTLKQKLIETNAPMIWNPWNIKRSHHVALPAGLCWIVDMFCAQNRPCQKAWNSNVEKNSEVGFIWKFYPTLDSMSSPITYPKQAGSPKNTLNQQGDLVFSAWDPILVVYFKTPRGWEQTAHHPTSLAARPETLPQFDTVTSWRILVICCIYVVLREKSYPIFVGTIFKTMLEILFGILFIYERRLLFMMWLQ